MILRPLVYIIPYFVADRVRHTPLHCKFTTSSVRAFTYLLGPRRPTKDNLHPKAKSSLKLHGVFDESADKPSQTVGPPLTPRCPEHKRRRQVSDLLLAGTCSSSGRGHQRSQVTLALNEWGNRCAKRDEAGAGEWSRCFMACLNRDTLSFPGGEQGLGSLMSHLR
jgi:hypothetical protein